MIDAVSGGSAAPAPADASRLGAASDTTEMSAFAIAAPALPGGPPRR